MAVNLSALPTSFSAVNYQGISHTIGAETFKVYMTDENSNILWAVGTTVPTDAGAGFAKGCLFIDSDVATGTTGLYCNKGTSSSCQFTAVTQG